MLCFPICTPFLFAPSTLRSANFKRKQAQNLWHYQYLNPVLKGQMFLRRFWHPAWKKLINLLQNIDLNPSEVFTRHVKREPALHCCPCIGGLVLCESERVLSKPMTQSSILGRSMAPPPSHPSSLSSFFSLCVRNGFDGARDSICWGPTKTPAGISEQLGGAVAARLQQRQEVHPPDAQEAEKPHL